MLTPTINYGGGVDASQRIVNEYAQLISGGKINIKISTDTNLENDNNESWLRDASLIIGLSQNLNEFELKSREIILRLKKEASSTITPFP